MGSSDQKWFEDVYEKYAPAVLRYAKGLYRCFPWLPNDPEDIVQEVFLCLYENRDSIYDLGGISAWLLKVARNKAYDYEDEQKRRARIIDDYASIDKAADTAAMNEIDEPDYEYYIKLCEDKIGSKNFEIMRKCSMNRGEIAKIAAKEGIKEGTLRVQIHRWRKTCAEVIKNAAWAELILLISLMAGNK